MDGLDVSLYHNYNVKFNYGNSCMLSGRETIYAFIQKVHIWGYSYLDVGIVMLFVNIVYELFFLT